MNIKAIDRAKAVVAEIVQQSAGDELVGTVRLYKAFYLAHLFYARENAGYLTDWPIVKMPMGPGISNFDELKNQLTADGRLEPGLFMTNVGCVEQVDTRWCVTSANRWFRREHSARRTIRLAQRTT